MSRLRVSKWRVRTKVSMRNPYSGIRIRGYKNPSFKSILRRQRLSIYCPRWKVLKFKRYGTGKFRKPRIKRY